MHEQAGAARGASFEPRPLGSPRGFRIRAGRIHGSAAVPGTFVAWLEHMVTETVLIYWGILALVGALVTIRVLLALSRSTQRRLRQLRKRKQFDAVATDSPVDDPTRLARERGAAAIQTHFTVTRKLIIPLVWGFILVAASFPFLNRVPAAVLSVVVGAITVLLGMAARPFVENAIAGLVISFSRLINIGDTVYVDDHYGTVEDISTTHTTIKVWDWRRYVLPNSRMLQSNFINYSIYDRYQWAYVEVTVGYSADLEKVRKLAIEAPVKSRYFAAHEPPRFWVSGMDKTSIRCWVAAWADSPSDAWLLKHDIRSDLAMAFQRENIPTHSIQFGAPPFLDQVVESPNQMVEENPPLRVSPGG